MPRKIELLIVLLMATLLTASISIGDEQECEAIIGRESPDLPDNWVDGSKEPEKIPYFMKYGTFVLRYQYSVRDQLVQQLTARDDAILYALSTGNATWNVTESARFEREFLQFCSNWANKDAVTLVKEYEQISANSFARRADRSRQAIDSLSDAGRQIVEKFVEETIAATISMSVRDSADLALEDLDGDMYFLEISCYQAHTGELPPEIQRINECFQEQPAVGRDGGPLAVSLESVRDSQD